MVYQQWRRSSGRMPEPVCPECTRLGMLLCRDCLRWLCRNHIAKHSCVRLNVSTANFIHEER